MNDIVLLFEEYCLFNVVVKVVGWGWLLIGLVNGLVGIFVWFLWLLNVYSLMIELGGIVLIWFLSVVMILLSWLLLFLLLGIDWLSMMVVVILVDVVIMVFVRVVCMELLFIDKVEGSVGKLVMGLFGGLMLLIWKLVLVSLVSCLGLCKYLVNVLVVDVCFCDSYVLLSSIVG